MRTIAKAALLALVVLMLAACQPAVTPAPATPEAVAPEVVTPEVVAPEAATPEVATPAVSPDLAGTSWVLSSLDGNLPVPDTTVTLQFGADGTASGTDGCNQYSTTFTQDGASLTINQPMASTMMACPEPIMNQAAAYRPRWPKSQASPPANGNWSCSLALTSWPPSWPSRRAWPTRRGM